MTSQVIPMCDGSPEVKVPIQERNQLRQTDRISRLGWKSSRLIVDLSRLTVGSGRLKLCNRELGYVSGVD